MGSCGDGPHRMTDREKQIALESIKAYERMIKYFQDRIEVLNYKMQDKCCFEKKELHKLKIKRTK